MTISELPHFSHGVQFREQHPTKEAARKWRYVLLRDVLLSPDGIADRMANARATFYDSRGYRWMQIDRYGILLKAGYAWNGCSPKKWVPVIGWIGTPDFASTWLASLFHDALYQFARTTHFPFNRSEVDALFFHTITKSGGKCIAGTYHGAVRKFSSWADRPKNGEYSKITLMP